MNFCDKILRHFEYLSEEGLFYSLVLSNPESIVPWSRVIDYHPGGIGSLANRLYYAPYTEEWLVM